MGGEGFVWATQSTRHQKEHEIRTLSVSLRRGARGASSVASGKATQHHMSDENVTYKGVVDVSSTDHSLWRSKAGTPTK